MNQFIKKNREFLSFLKKKEIDGRLLVEAPSAHNFITHCMAMQTVIINQGKGYQPLWIINENTPIELLKSYVPDAEYVKLPRLNILNIIHMIVIVFFQINKVILLNSILTFRFGWIKYGDILYDQYLRNKRVGSIGKKTPKVCFRILKLMLSIAKRHILIRKCIRKNNITAVLTSHKIGIEGGILYRAALRSKCHVYSNSGMHRNTLILSKKKRDIYDYGYKPTKEEIKNIFSFKDDAFNKKYEEVKNYHMFGTASCDAKYAFSDENILYKDKNEFCEKYSLDSSKKNIFIMLHAFNDYPHSHFKSMIFNDYKDWFVKTYEYAKQDNSVNWIFKTHPSEKFYQIEDLDTNELFNDVPDNVILVGGKDKIDTRSLGVISDAIITCIGSAGFEIPAFFGIPSITAGDNHYSEYSFASNPKSKKEYFNELKQLHSITRLSKRAQREAQAFYMFTYQYSCVDYSFIPVLSFEDIHGSPLTDRFYKAVLETYKDNEEIIKKQLMNYSYEVSRSNFKALRDYSFKPYDDCIDIPFELSYNMGEKEEKIMEEGCSILEKLNVKYCLAEGTLLGIYRDNALIKHDSDIDLHVILPCDISKIREAFYNNGFTVGRRAVAYGKTQQLALYKNNVLFDMIFFSEYDKFMYSFSEKDFYMKHDEKYYKSLDKITFKGIEYPTPAYTEDFLKFVYGKNWNIPKSAKSPDWRKHREDSDEYRNLHEYNGDPESIFPGFNQI